MISRLRALPWSRILPWLIVITPFFFFLIGIPFQEIASDASNYVSYATHIVNGQGYTYDATPFNNLREPGYPLFLSLIFALFGLENYWAVYIIQTILLGLIGLMVYKLFQRRGELTIGAIAGFLVVLIPSYGLYTHMVGTEMLFAFLIMTIFTLVMSVLSRPTEHVYWQYAALGLVFGIATLVRLQLLFFLPLLILAYLIFFRKKVVHIWKKSLITAICFAVVILSWMTFVHSQTGKFTLTSGRPELALYTRAVRTKLSYPEMTRYGYEWLYRSLTGGEGSDFLYQNEYHKIGNDYWAMATSSAAVKAIRAESIHTITSRPVHFLYGNFVEAIKTVYIEHDYGNVLNRYIRAGTYLVLYSLFLFGCYMLLRKRKILIKPELKLIAYMALLFIAYNIAILSPFDSIPRYNTPYLTFYLIIGFVGIALFLRSKNSSNSN